MNTVKKTPKDRAETRRAQILDAAEKCFRQRGFHATSMAEISAAAKMSAGHIYNYFESKEAIIAEIAKEQVATLFDETEQTLAMCLERHISDAKDQDRLGLMFEVIIEARRHAGLQNLVAACHDKAQAQMKRICAQHFQNAQDKDADAYAKMLSMVLLGFKACALLRDEAADHNEAILRALIKKIVGP